MVAWEAGRQGAPLLAGSFWCLTSRSKQECLALWVVALAPPAVTWVATLSPCEQIFALLTD